MTISNWMIILAVILAPLIAVHVQKKLEYLREDREQKKQIFKTLMATRAATVSIEHVQALNMINLEFQGNKYRPVREAWKVYLDHLGSFPKNENQGVGGQEQSHAQAVWDDKKQDRLAGLLNEMGKSLGYNFDEVDIKKGIYSPEAHGQQENEQILLRRGLVQLIYGELPLKMEVTSFPYDETFATEQKEVLSSMKRLLDGEQAIKVKHECEDPQIDRA